MSDGDTDTVIVINRYEGFHVAIEWKQFCKILYTTPLHLHDCMQSPLHTKREREKNPDYEI